MTKEEFRRLVLRLTTKGISVPAISKNTGISEGVLSSIKYGRSFSLKVGMYDALLTAYPELKKSEVSESEKEEIEALKKEVEELEKKFVRMSMAYLDQLDREKEEKERLKRELEEARKKEK